VRGPRSASQSALRAVNELREPAPTRIGRVTMNEHECPCADHAYGLRGSQSAAAKYRPDIHLFRDLKERIG
jgi:hypothetical protein